ncbi:MAG: hypothetical protein WDN69_11325 [Aliidongia sp.]
MTSAMHMPRAVGIARKLGWNLLPWPVDYSTPADETLHSEGHFGKYLDEVSGRHPGMAGSYTPIG